MRKPQYLPRIKPLSRPTVVEINLKNLEHNLQLLKNIIQPEVKIIAIVKADAYGHGATFITKRLEECGVWGFGVALVEEGVELRLNGIKNPILILNGLWTVEGLQYAIDYNLTPVIFNRYQLELLRAYFSNCLPRSRLKVHLKVDTGMNRLGFTEEELISFLNNYESHYNWLEVEGVMSHLAYADEGDESFTFSQYIRFLNIIKAMKEKGVYPQYIHLANSAAAIRFPYTHFNMIRVGLFLYGINPTRGDNRVELPLRPLMKVSTRIIQLRELRVGDRVSYGGSFEARYPTKIAVLPVGYADGIPRLLSNRGYVVVKGEKARIVGHICMDLLMVDVTGIEGVREGDEVKVIGDEAEEITVDYIANLIGTIPYEILTSISQRIPRTYIG